MDTSDITRQLLNAEGGATFSFSSKQSVKYDGRAPELPTPNADLIIERMMEAERAANKETEKKNEQDTKISTTQTEYKAPARSDKAKKKG